MFQYLCVCVDEYMTKCFDGFEHQIKSSLYYKQVRLKNSQFLFL